MNLAAQLAASPLLARICGAALLPVTRTALVALAVPPLLISCLTTSPYSAVALLLFAAALGLAALGLQWAAQRAAAANPAPHASKLLITGAALLILLLTSGGFALCIVRVREIAAASSMHAQLRALHAALQQSGAANAPWPPDAAALRRAAGLAASGTPLRSPGDPRRADTDDSYTSLVYEPGRWDLPGHPQIIIAYEREPWTPLQFRLWSPPRGCWTLFFDGAVRKLSETELRSALATSAGLRSELGWNAPPRRKP